MIVVGDKWIGEFCALAIISTVHFVSILYNLAEKFCMEDIVVEGIVVEGIVVEGTGRGNVAFVGDMMGLG